ncbi:hypothetical protein NE237_003379 [Protea cynaroides]|uniref:Uncharacterized protein n=1 Tax=Protea cynaroides TaxID=273540 RepID=A0A9Q0KGZ2_9MAGN|nr:hypothetical protein NE237_003379 [Protea cynaroides]
MTLPPSNFKLNMAEPSHCTNPITVVGTQFGAPHPVDLVIVWNVEYLGEQNFFLSDVNGNIVFKTKGIPFSFHDRHLLLNANDRPLLSMRKKQMVSIYTKWQVFRGDDSHSKNLLFSVKKSSWNSNWVLDVFLAANIKEEVCDFKIKGSWAERSCIIYIGDSDNIIAQMHKKHGDQGIDLGMGNFMVIVCANVDYAFIAALIMITASFSMRSLPTPVPMGGMAAVENFGTM